MDTSYRGRWWLLLGFVIGIGWGVYYNRPHPEVVPVIDFQDPSVWK